ncbi:MAG TPA: amidase, partial [Pyrinomonadaceae bacterium]
MTRLSAVRLAALVRARAVSPVEVVEAHLRRVEEVNPRLNAVVTLSPDAVARARALEAALARGEDAGPLAGVPVTVKDTIETVDLRTTFGSRVFVEHVPKRDAPAVARLRAAGAIILGKTNVSELALDYTAENTVFGRTNNPFDDERTPGGSSGGCAAALSACLTAGSLGSDLVGSLRIPAHFCGIAALRPTAGRVPGAGHLPPLSGPFALGASLGPLARRVEDLALLFGVLTGEDLARQSEDTGDALLKDVAALLRGRRVAWYADDGATPVIPEIARAVEAAARALEDAGMSAVERRPPHVERATELWLGLFSYPTQEFLRRTYAGREEDAGSVARLLLERAERASAPTANAYFELWDERDRLRGELLE